MKKFFYLIIMHIIIIISIANVLPVYADSTDNIISTRIDELYNLIGNTYFTTDQSSAGNSDSKCLVSNVTASAWFQNKFNIWGLSTLQFPTCARYPGSHDAYSCTGFSLFAEWYIFKNANTAYVKTDKLSKMSFNYSNIFANAKIGDLISLSGNKYNSNNEYKGIAGHEFIFISANSNSVTVLDSNWGNSCKVTKHTIGYYYCDYFQIARATNRGDALQPPTTAVLSINKGTNSIYAVNETVTFTFEGGNDARTLGIYKGEKRIATEQVTGNTYSRSFSEPGLYSAYMTVYNDAGYKDSNWVGWEVSPAINPADVYFSSNKNICCVDDDITFTYSGLSAAESVTIHFEKDGREYWSDNATSNTNYTTHFITSGTYSVYVTGYYDGQTYTSNKVNIYIMNSAANTTLAGTNTDITFSYDGLAYAQEVKILFEKNGELYFSDDTTYSKSYTTYFQSTGQYTVYYAAKFNGNWFYLNKMIINIVEPVFSSDKKVVNRLEDITFTYDGLTYASEVTIQFEKDGVKYYSTDMTKSKSHTNNFISDGNYSVFVTAQYAGGTVTSQKVFITVGKYAITYNGKGSDTVFSSQEKTYNNDITVSNIIPAREHYKFLGWATTDNATNVEYQPGDTFTKNEDTTLYAVWKPIPHTETTVSKTANGCSANINLYNIPELSKIVIAGYNGKKFVTIKAIDYTKDTETVELIGNIDTIKVMVWDSMKNIIPVTSAETIPCADWLVN